MTGKQLRIAFRIDAAMQAFAQTGEDDMAVLADMEHYSHSDWASWKTRQGYSAIPTSSAQF